MPFPPPLPFPPVPPFPFPGVDGGVGGAGNGLTGLRERVGAFGGTLVCTGTLRGWRVRAEVPAAVATVPAPATVPVTAP